MGWNPDQGDEAWCPDPDRPEASYTDDELRFCPLYRRVRGVMESQLPYQPTEADILSETRTVLRNTLAD